MGFTRRELDSVRAWLCASLTQCKCDSVCNWPCKCFIYNSFDLSGLDSCWLYLSLTLCEIHYIKPDFMWAGNHANVTLCELDSLWAQLCASFTLCVLDSVQGWTFSSLNLCELDSLWPCLCVSLSLCKFVFVQAWLHASMTMWSWPYLSQTLWELESCMSLTLNMCDSEWSWQCVRVTMCVWVVCELDSAQT